MNNAAAVPSRQDGAKRHPHQLRELVVGPWRDDQSPHRDENDRRAYPEDNAQKGVRAGGEAPIAKRHNARDFEDEAKSQVDCGHRSQTHLGGVP